jgi:hypothetical protein
MTDRTDAANTSGQRRHFGKRASLTELLKSTKLGDVKPGIPDLAGIIEVQSDFAVSLDAGYGINDNLSGHGLFLSSETGMDVLGEMPLQDGFENCVNQVGPRRTSRHVEIDRNDLVKRSAPLKQHGEASLREPVARSSIFSIGALKDSVHRVRVAHSGDVAGYSTVPQSDQNLRPFSNEANFMQVFVARDCPLYQCQVHRIGELLPVYEGAIKNLNPVGEFNDSFIHIEERHVTPGASIEPNGGQSYFSHRFRLRMDIR